MKFFLSIILSTFFLINANAQITIDVDSHRCEPEQKNEIPVYSSDYKWDMTLDEIKSKSDEMYKNTKRLSKRSRYDSKEKSFEFPMESVNGGNAKIPLKFIKAITQHVEKAFQRSYVNALIFPDMGHSHFLVPMDYYKKKLADLPVSQFNHLYEMIFENKDVKVVYHTAEQLKMLDENKKVLDDKKVQWRFFTRNLIGHNNENPDLEIYNATESSAANAMGEIPGYYWWGGGFNIHANQNGCFPFQRDGKTYYFDLSLSDLEPDPNSGYGY